MKIYIYGLLLWRVFSINLGNGVNLSTVSVIFSHSSVNIAAERVDELSMAHSSNTIDIFTGFGK